MRFSVPSLRDVDPRVWFTTGNLVAGVSVGAYLIPQAMAYGTLAGVGAAVGLATAIVPLIVYSIVGAHRWLSVGPESTVALMAAAAAGPAAQSTGLPVTSVLAAMAVVVGAVLIIGRFLRAGFLADLLSVPVLLGYLTGIAALMVMSQVQRLTGIDANTDDIWSFLFDTPWTAPDLASLAVGIAVALISWLLPLWNSRIPGALIALALSIPAGIWLGLPSIGDVTGALPHFAVPPLQLQVLGQLILPAVTVAAVAFADVMVTARAISDGTRVNAEREMVAVGAAQVATGFFSGYPVSASSSRTALARAAGATSRHYSLVVAVILVVAPFALGKPLSAIPQAALAGVILYAAISLIDVAEWRKLRALHRTETAVAAACTLAVLSFGILPGIAFAIIASVFAFLARLARPTTAVLGFSPMAATLHSLDNHEELDTVPGLVVFRYNAPLFFINAPDFYDEALAVVEDDTKVLLVTMETSANLDVTSLDTLEELAATLKGMGVELWLARVRFEVLELMRTHGVMKVVGEDNIHENMATALAHYRSTAADI